LITAFTVFHFRPQGARFADGVQISRSRARIEIACSDESYPACERIDRERKLDEERKQMPVRSRYDDGGG
jgi:hypothetical protein